MRMTRDGVKRRAEVEGNPVVVVAVLPDEAEAEADASSVPSTRKSFPLPVSTLAGLVSTPDGYPTTWAFKEETLGLKPVELPSAPVSSPKKEIFRASGKYKYSKGEIGEAPTLEED
ncbi:hypothetical protein PRIC1_010535 [Phytophthora ramorum]|uniref:uncharacterized protein n=1 Tax=Phytophthora ramorum TaxID=164328 RepID=UPI0030986B64|nr:hypothetical protein KRP23_2956 [Phytophthora ramorum]